MRLFCPLLKYTISVAVTLFSYSSYAAMVEDFTLFAVGDRTGGGGDAIYGYSTLGGTPVEFATIPNPPQYINGLTTDADRNRLLFVRDGTATGSPTLGNLWSLDLGTFVYTDLGIISTSEINVTETTGGGGFYNGSYYYWDDARFDPPGSAPPPDPAPDQGLIRVDFNLDGTVASSTTVWESAEGDFGDLAIDRNTGIMYVSSQDENDDWIFWSLDLNAAPSRTDIAANVPYQQIAFDNNGDLIGVEITGTTQNFFLISLSDGSSSTITRVVPPGNVYDLGDGGLYNLTPVPEPGSMLLLALASVSGIGYLRRKRRNLSSESLSV